MSGIIVNCLPRGGHGGCGDLWYHRARKRSLREFLSSSSIAGPLGEDQTRAGERELLRCGEGVRSVAEQREEELHGKQH